MRTLVWAITAMSSVHHCDPRGFTRTLRLRPPTSSVSRKRRTFVTGVLSGCVCVDGFRINKGKGEARTGTRSTHPRNQNPTHQLPRLGLPVRADGVLQVEGQHVSGAGEGLLHGRGAAPGREEDAPDGLRVCACVLEGLGLGS